MYCTKCETHLGNEPFCSKCGQQGSMLGWGFVLTPLVVQPVLGFIAGMLIAFLWPYPIPGADRTTAGGFAILLGLASAVGGVIMRARLRSKLHAAAPAAPAPSFAVGDRVRIKGNAGTVKPADSGFAEEIILDDVHPITGTVARAGYLPMVRWDAGTYRVFRDTVRTSEGKTLFLDKGTVELPAFDDAVHTDYLTAATDTPRFYSTSRTDSTSRTGASPRVGV